MPTVCCIESINNDTKEKKRIIKKKTSLILSWWQFAPEVPIRLWNSACKRQTKNSVWLSQVPARLAIKVLEHLCHWHVTQMSCSLVTAPPALTTLVPFRPASTHCLSPWSRTNPSKPEMHKHFSWHTGLGGQSPVKPLSKHWAAGGTGEGFRKPRYRSTAKCLKPVCLYKQGGNTIVSLNSH